MCKIGEDGEYLFGDLDEQDKDDENKQVVKNAECSGDAKNDFQCKVTVVLQDRTFLFEREGGDVAPVITR